MNGVKSGPSMGYTAISKTCMERRTAYGSITTWIGSELNEIPAFVDGAAQSMEIEEVVEPHLLSMVMKVGREALLRFLARDIKAGA